MAKRGRPIKNPPKQGPKAIPKPPGKGRMYKGKRR